MYESSRGGGGWSPPPELGIVSYDAMLWQIQDGSLNFTLGRPQSAPGDRPCHGSTGDNLPGLRGSPARMDANDSLRWTRSGRRFTI